MTSEPKEGLWRRLSAGLARTHDRLREQLAEAFEARVELDEATREALEEALIGADVGLATSSELVERLARRAKSRAVDEAGGLAALLAIEVGDWLAEVSPPSPPPAFPLVTLIVGVNGAGKTTTIAKLARRDQAAGRRVLIAAADTFRAAASEQLAVWGERLGVEVVRRPSGADPAAIVHDAARAAIARGVEHLIVDTAGRLHTKEHLMAELAKVRRVIEREAVGWGVRTLLVLDATTGQNGLVQAREFGRAAAVDGVVVTKLDGTARGGVALAVARELRLPILYLGVGEGADDLVDFDPREFARALLS